MKRIWLVVVGVVTVAALAVPAASSAHTAAPVAKARPHRVDKAPPPRAHAACLPVCLIAVPEAIDAAEIIGTAIVAATATEAVIHAPQIYHVTKEALSRVFSTAKTIRNKGPRFVKRRWRKLPKKTKQCLYGIAVFQTSELRFHRKITYDQWKSFVLFYLPLFPPQAYWTVDFNWGKKQRSAYPAACLAGILNGYAPKILK